MDGGWWIVRPRSGAAEVGEQSKLDRDSSGVIESVSESVRYVCASVWDEYGCDRARASARAWDVEVEGLFDGASSRRLRSLRGETRNRRYRSRFMWAHDGMLRVLPPNTSLFDSHIQTQFTVGHCIPFYRAQDGRRNCDGRVVFIETDFGK